MNLPYLTAKQPGIGGRIKLRPEDFYVEEIPLYLPSGQGQHLYVEIEKTGLATYPAIRKIAQALNISPKSIGYAGQKDAQAVTRQTLSLDHVTPEAVAALDLNNIKILKAKRHNNKLRLGHLLANRFVIRVRDVEQGVMPLAESTLAILAQQGVPNFFGAQRFGNRGNTDKLGELLLRQDAAEFASEYLGRPQSHENPVTQTARQLVDQGQWSEALAQWPRNLSDERRALIAINKANGQVDGVFKALNNKLKSFFVSAFQSRLFNLLLVERLDSLGQLKKGDVAYIHKKGAAFMVENASLEQPRADRLEISPSGPLFGTKTLFATEKPGRREAELLAHYNLSLDSFKIPGLKIQGARRPYRFTLSETKVWWDDEGLMLSFELSPGSYATRVMAEIMKN